MANTMFHHRIEIAADEYSVEVWADDPAPGFSKCVMLFLERSRRDSTETFYVDLTPAEARALAALLVVGAERQEPKASQP